MSAKSEQGADSALEAEKLYPEVWRVLENVGHFWSYDARSEEIFCKDCEWYAEGSFLDCAKKARQHRDDVKEAVLRLTLTMLRIDGPECTSR